MPAAFPNQQVFTQQGGPNVTVVRDEVLEQASFYTWLKRGFVGFIILASLVLLTLAIWLGFTWGSSSQSASAPAPRPAAAAPAVSERVTEKTTDRTYKEVIRERPSPVPPPTTLSAWDLPQNR